MIKLTNLHTIKLNTLSRLTISHGLILGCSGLIITIMFSLLLTELTVTWVDAWLHWILVDTYKQKQINKQKNTDVLNGNA